MILKVAQFPKVGQSNKMGEVGHEANICVINASKTITVTGHPLFKLLLKTQQHVF